MSMAASTPSVPSGPRQHPCCDLQSKSALLLGGDVTKIDDGSLGQPSPNDHLHAPPVEKVPPATIPRWEDPVWTAWLLVSDLVLAALSVPLALLLVAPLASNHINQMSSFTANLKAGALFPVCIVIGMAIAGTYRSSLRFPNQSTFTMLKDFLLGVSLGAIVGLIASNIFHHVGNARRLSSLLAVAIALVTLVLITLGRVFVRHLALSRRPVRVLVVDSGLRKDRIATHLRLQHGYVFVGWVVSSDAAPDDAVGTLHQLPQLVEELAVDQVIVGSTQMMGSETISIYRSVLPSARISIVPRTFELISWRSRLTDMSGLPLLEVAPPLMTRVDRATKRLIDIIGASLALLVTLPFWIPIAIGIKLTSTGPVFFRQPRLGRGRREFTIVKFRTLIPLVEEEHATGEIADDSIPLYRLRDKARTASRETPFGNWLRRFGIDEIPQFINVLLGDMSIVGPRPFIPSESDGHDGWSARRFEVRPGITGLWQVSGRNELTADELRQLDYLYVTSWSVFWDLRIMVETPKVMVRGLGAY